MKVSSGAMLILVMSFFLLAGCSKETRESKALYNDLMQNVDEINSLDSTAAIADKLSLYSQASHRIEILRTEYATTSKGEEIQSNPTLEGGITIEDILDQANEVKAEASTELTEYEVRFIELNTLPVSKARNSRLEGYGISLARQGDVDNAEAIIPHLVNTLSVAIVQLEVAKAYQQKGDYYSADEFYTAASDNLGRYNFNESICSTEECSNEETRARMVKTEMIQSRQRRYLN
ncbi:hypothetical protein [Vreelandella populi]|uniref:Lipoprotein n=1 Tax=Vreelandella populi TaxID=2498858 RepID=A0A433LH82_9GAMM|nr:hypothetical protein [Halomonas populi]RUR40868.1 hypothetical protein ELY25_04170 [Halomonas populi]RUR49376.1 hypothetical protein ELY37_01345 [Halomonas populi]